MHPIAQAGEHLDQAYAYYEAAEDFEAALEECDAALDFDPDLAEAHHLRGILLEELDRPLDALSAYKKALRLSPDFPEALENQSVLKAELADRGEMVTIATFSYPTEAYIPSA
jgi:tetratricopeptide (TPR) repeat protein